MDISVLCTPEETARIASSILECNVFTSLCSGDRTILIECELPFPTQSFDDLCNNMWAKFLLLHSSAPICTACSSCAGECASYVCSGCLSARYCSVQCQRKHWPLHKPSCMALAVGAVLGGRSREELVAEGGRLECLYCSGFNGPNDSANAKGVFEQLLAVCRPEARSRGFRLLHCSRTEGIAAPETAFFLMLFILPGRATPDLPVSVPDV